MAAGGAACAVWCYGLRLTTEDRELLGFIGSYAEGHTVYANVMEINLCMALIGGFNIPSNGLWRTSTFVLYYGNSVQYYAAANTSTYCDQGGYTTLPFFYYEL